MFSPGIPAASSARRSTPSIVTAIIVGAIVLTLLSTWLFYVCSRLGFAFFDIVLHREQFVAPSWRSHRSASFKWATLKLIAGTLWSVPRSWFR